MPVSRANAAARSASRLATALTLTFRDGRTASTNRRAMRAAPSTPILSGAADELMRERPDDAPRASIAVASAVDHRRHLRDAVVDVRRQRALRARPVAVQRGLEQRAVLVGRDRAAEHRRDHLVAQVL